MSTISTVPTAAAQPQDRQAASEAYDRGTEAFEAGNFEEAAVAYEEAHRYAPATAALVQAARAHALAGNQRRAATLALTLVEDYPDHAVATQVAAEILKSRAALVLVQVQCNDCNLTLAGAPQVEHRFFVQPDTTHTLVAEFATGPVRETLSGAAGTELNLAFTAPVHARQPRPPPIARTVRPRPPPVQTTTTEPSQVDGARPFRPAVVYVGAGLTVALVAASVLSTVDTLSGVEDYEAAVVALEECPQSCDRLQQSAQAQLHVGNGKETRTDIAWIATGAVATGTLLTALLLTDWQGESKGQPHGIRLEVGRSDQGMTAKVGIAGSF